MKQNSIASLVVDYKRITDLCLFCNDLMSANIRNSIYDGLGYTPSHSDLIELIGATCNRASNRKLIIKITKNGSNKIKSLSKVFVSQLGTDEMIDILDSYSTGNQSTKDIADLLRTQLNI